MNQEEKVCCVESKSKTDQGLWTGVLYGLIPHTFCIAFALATIVGATTVTAFLKQFLLIPNLFIFLVFISLILATISSVIYLRKIDCLCLSGIKGKWRYLSMMYLLTISVNLLMFFWVVPALANVDLNKITKANDKIVANSSLTDLNLKVELPCSGHASLIMDEIKKNCSVESIKFELPNTFIIKYDPAKLSPEKVTSLEIFKTYKATVN